MFSRKKKAMSSKRSANKLSVSNNDTIDIAEKYTKSEFDNTYYLGYRELRLFLEKYSCGVRAIDYGCGTGRSTRFLQANGFQVIGVDISKKMLQQAMQLDNESYYLHIKNGRIPVFNNSCDLVLSVYVMFTVPSKKEMLAIFKEAHRCLRDEGIFIIVTGSEELYSHEWLSYSSDCSQNRNLKSGDAIKIKLKDLGIEFVNYYWTDDDYSHLFNLSGFKILEKHFPYGKANEGKSWVSEMEYPPYVVYILQKC